MKDLQYFAQRLSNRSIFCCDSILTILEKIDTRYDIAVTKMIRIMDYAIENNINLDVAYQKMENKND